MKKKSLLLLMLTLALCALFAFGAFAEEGTVTPCDPGKHVFSAWEDVEPATCFHTGTQKRVCTICGYEETQTSNALKHKFETEKTVDVAATCTAAGSKSLHCIYCGTKQSGSSEVIPATGHSFSAWEELTPATCLGAGSEVRRCKNCDLAETRTVPALGHQTVTEYALAASCTKEGRTEGSYCSRCNTVFKKSEIVPALGHDIVDVPAKEPTCTEDGMTAGAKCTRCDYVQKQQIVLPKLGHKTVVDKGYPSTCTEHGKTEGSHCSVCGTVFYAQQELPLMKHQYAESVIEKTCISDGCHRFTCVNCGDTYDTDIDYALGHVMVVEKTIEETCTTDGLSVRTYCSVCGEVLEEAHVIPAFGHQWTDTVTKATRKKDGKIVTSCTVCGAVQGETVIAKIGTITLSKTKYYCDGTKKTPDIVITDANGKKLIYKKDFTATWDSGRKKPGVYYVTVTFIGNYSGSKTMRFSIILHKTVGVKVTAGKGKAKVTWGKTTGAQQYIVYICDTKTGKYKKAGTTNKTSLTVKNLQSGKTYYFIVRATATDANGKTYKNENSPIRKAKIL